MESITQNLRYLKFQTAVEIILSWNFYLSHPFVWYFSKYEHDFKTGLSFFMDFYLSLEVAEDELSFCITKPHNVYFDNTEPWCAKFKNGLLT